MSKSQEQSQSGISGAGRWLAVASELPCSVIIMVIIGRILGESWWGLQGATWGAIFGAIFGFFFGVYGVYKTINFLDDIEKKQKIRTTYMPSEEEIFEDVKFDLEDDE
ncbi:MAG: hypothetical protein BAJATHORv1_50176 [Candidatus Thorarchaeota archaeon]|nr:MAG: hypothetical protein BAJATHORv1_50176 [Candidatus Thorarchaeota archaeon]